MSGCSLTCTLSDLSSFHTDLHLFHTAVHLLILGKMSSSFLHVVYVNLQCVCFCVYCFHSTNSELNLNETVPAPAVHMSITDSHLRHEKRQWEVIRVTETVT